MTEKEKGRGLSSGGFYYCQPDQVGESTLRLLPDEARHAVRVLRLGEGDEIAVVDGKGGWYLVRVQSIDRDGLVGEIIDRKENVGESSLDLTIGLGLLKQSGRFETFIEKAVELGVTAIVPMLSQRTQSKSINPQRCQRVLLAGLKQAMRSRIPRLTEPTRFVDALKSKSEIKFMAHEGANTDGNILDYREEISLAESATVLVGPEGGFADEELTLARNKGWHVISLGDARLRSETAGIAAASAILLMRSHKQ